MSTEPCASIATRSVCRFCSRLRRVSRFSTPEPGFDHPGSVLYFAVDDIQQMHDTLTSRGIAFRTEPHRIATLADREVWLADFEDTEGNTLALMSEPRLSQ
jgi:predicted enzyme related to lactoylglutathione lyase